MTLVNRLFNLRPGDFARGLPLFLYYLLIVMFYMLGRNSRDSIFLDVFDRTKLPYADIAVAALSGVLVAIYLRASRGANLRNLQVGTLVAFAAMLPMLWFGVHVEQSKAVSVIYYVWVGVCGMLCISQVWMLANAVWTTREAKRRFGMLGSGGIVGGIVAGFVTQGIAKKFGTDAILLFMAAQVAACVPLVMLIWHQQAREDGEPDVEREDSRNLRESWRLMVASPHLRAIAILILIGSVVTTIAGWQYKSLAKEAFARKDELTAFFGAVTGWTGIAALTLQLILTGKLLRRFGVGITLLILPVFLMAGSVSVLVWGTVWAGTFLRASDVVIRYSVDTSAIQLLYLPVAAHIKLQVKSFIDTVIWKVGDGIAGLTLLLFATKLQLTPREIGTVSLIMIAAWLVAAMVARREYVATLRENIQGTRLAVDAVVPTLDHTAVNLLAEKLSSPHAKDVLYGLTLFEIGQRAQSHAAVRKLLEHPSAEVRTKAVAILDEAGDRSVRPQVLTLLKDEDLVVRTEALRYLTHHDEFDPLTQIDELRDFSSAAVRSATVTALARPGDGQNLDAAAIVLDQMVGETGAAGREARLDAGRILASIPDYFEDQLDVLLRDDDPDVLREALIAAGRRRRRRFAPAMIAQLAKPDLREDAIEAIAMFEDSVVGTLRDHLLDSKESDVVRQAIPEVLRRIGTNAAATALSESLLEQDLALRFRVISALNKLQETRRDVTLDRQQIDTAMIAELMGHYRSYQILGANGGVRDAALDETMALEVERIFRLMKLLSPTLDLKEAYMSARSTDAVRHANALEFLDNILSPQLRTLIVPLLDSEVSVAERVKLADRFLGFSAASEAAARPAPRPDRS